MKDFRGKTAVITGAASGIGRAIAQHCAGEGMNVVIADIDDPELKNAEIALRVTEQVSLV